MIHCIRGKIGVARIPKLVWGEGEENLGSHLSWTLKLFKEGPCLFVLHSLCIGIIPVLQKEVEMEKRNCLE